MFQHILVPLDGSPRAERAVPVAARIAREVNGSVLLVQVMNLSHDYSGGLAMVPVMSEQMIESEMADAAAYLKTVTRQMLEGIPTTNKVLFGIPAQCILGMVAERSIDLVVLCSHGRTGFTRWALGSVAHTLAHENSVPTLVLRESELASVVADTSRPLCALVPLDGSELAEAALAPAAQLVAVLAAPAPSMLELVQVVQPSHEKGEAGKDHAGKEDRTRASAYLSQMAERLQTTAKDSQFSINQSVLIEHDVASALVKQAEQGDEGEGSGSRGACDLIAISTHGRNGLERWVMGSVTDRLLNTSKLPMLIVRSSRKA